MSTLIEQVNSIADKPYPGLSGRHSKGNCECYQSKQKSDEICLCACTECQAYQPIDGPLDVMYSYNGKGELCTIAATATFGGPTIVITVTSGRGHAEGFWESKYHRKTLTSDIEAKKIFDHLKKRHPFRDVT